MAEIPSYPFHREEEKLSKQNQADKSTDTSAKKPPKGNVNNSHDIVVLNGQRFILTPVEEPLTEDLKAKEGGVKGSEGTRRPRE